MISSEEAPLRETPMAAAAATEKQAAPAPGSLLPMPAPASTSTPGGAPAASVAAPTTKETAAPPAKVPAVARAKSPIFDAMEMASSRSAALAIAESLENSHDGASTLHSHSRSLFLSESEHEELDQLRDSEPEASDNDFEFESALSDSAEPVMRSDAGPSTSSSNVIKSTPVPESTPVPIAGHFTVTRVANNGPKNRHVIKFNSIMSDGDKSTWSKHSTVEHPVQTWFQHVQKTDDINIEWRKKIGTGLAFLLKLGKGKSPVLKSMTLCSYTATAIDIAGFRATEANLDGQPKEFWILEDLPKDYRLFRKHFLSGPSNMPRTDTHLFGAN